MHVDFIALHLRWFLWWVVVHFVMVPFSLLLLEIHEGRGIFSFPLPIALIFCFSGSAIHAAYSYLHCHLVAVWEREGGRGFGG